jgi:hypothetical protein
MEASSLLGVWTGTVHNSNGWDMKITISVLQPFEIGAMLGIFDIPLIPCSGTFRVIQIQDRTLELQAERLHGECEKADSYSLELRPDATVVYTAKGKDWEAQGILRQVSL